MAVTDDARDHLFQTISRQYEPEDARTLITLLSSGTNPDDVATRADLRSLARQSDLDVVRADVTELKVDVTELKVDVAELRADLHQSLHQQSKTYATWMFGLLTVYTAMAGSFVALGALVIM